MVLSLSFLIALVTFVSSYIATMKQESLYLYGDFDVAYHVTPDQPASLSDQSGFEYTGHLYNIGRTFGQRSETSVFSEIGCLDVQGEALSYLKLKQGHFPQSRNEVAMTENALLLWKLDNQIQHEISIGDTISIPCVDFNHITEKSPSYRQEFVLSGILTDLDTRQNIRTIPFPSIYFSTEQLSNFPNYIETLLLKADDPSNISKYSSNLSSLELIKNDLKYTLTGNKLAEGYHSMFSNLWLVAVLILLITSVSVCASYMISAKEREKNAGLLRALGATRKQILKLNLLEISILLAVSTLVSILLGLGTSYFFVIGIMTQVQQISFLFTVDILLLFLVVAWTLIIVLICVYIFSKRMTFHPPIRLILGDNVSIRRHPPGRHLSHSALWRLYVRFLSHRPLPISVAAMILAISCVVLTQTSLLASSFTEQYKPWEIADYMLSTENIKASGGYDYLNMPFGDPLSFTTEDLETLEHHPAVDLYTACHSLMTTEILISEEQLNGKNAAFMPPNDLRSKLQQDIADWGDAQRLDQFDQHMVSCGISSDDYLFSINWVGFDNDTLHWFEQFLVEGEIDLDALNAGKQALIVDIAYTDDVVPETCVSPFEVGQIVQIMDFYPLTEEDGLDEHILGPVKRVDYPIQIGGRLKFDDPSVFARRDLLKMKTSSNIITGLGAFSHCDLPFKNLQISFFLKENADWQSFESSLKNTAQTDLFMISSRRDEKERVEALRLTTKICGTALTLMVALLGFFSFASVMQARIARRQRSFAILRSIGMTSRQLRVLILTESIFYGILSAVSGLIFSIFFFIVFHSQTGSFPWLLLVLYLISLVAGSFLFTIFPAAKASKSSTIKDIQDLV